MRRQNKHLKTKICPGWAHNSEKGSSLEAEASFCYNRVIIKLMFKLFVRIQLERYVKKYLERHPAIKLVIVVGSVGKTSAKSAIGTVLKQNFRVRVNEGNHNAELSAPLAILGIDYPENLRSIKTWQEIFSIAKERVNKSADIDVIVQEVGSDRIGQVPHFGKYARPDIAVVTAVSPEHMEYFKTMQAVADEELSVVKFSQQVLINQDDIDNKYVESLKAKNIDTYGTTNKAKYHFVKSNFSVKDGFIGKFMYSDADESIDVSLHVMGDHSTRSAVAAGAVGLKLGMKPEEIKSGMRKIRAVSGRMNVLPGIKQSMIIDDSYNSSPLAASSALEALYDLDAPQRIAVLGSMNELGDSSPDEHKSLGGLCDPSKLDWVVTVGSEARKYLAPIAAKQGCNIKSFEASPEAGEFVKNTLKPSAIVLFKGSEGSIFLEEAIKYVLQNPDDDKKLVRQSAQWLARKDKFFASK